MEDLLAFLEEVKSMLEEVQENTEEESDYNDGYQDALVFIIEWLEEIT
jgi:hypothetical protein